MVKPDPATVEACAKVMDKLAIEQRETNEKYPDHAKAYPSWVDRVYVYERAASTIRSLVSGEPQTRSAHPAGIKLGPSEAIQSGYADYTPVTVRAHTVPNSAGALEGSHCGPSAGENDPVVKQDCAPAETVSALNSQYAGLEALLAAIHADDPKRELLVRVGDLMRENRALLSQFDVRRK